MDVSMMKAALLGDTCTGKTALLRQAFFERWEWSYEPTIEDTYRASLELDGTRYMLDITDTAGIESYWQDQRQSWIDKSNLIFLVYDLTSIATLEWIESMCRDVRVSCDGEIQHPLTDRRAVILVGTKSSNLSHEVARAKGLQLATEKSWRFTEISLDSRKDIKALFREAARHWMYLNGCVQKDTKLFTGKRLAADISRTRRADVASAKGISSVAHCPTQALRPDEIDLEAETRGWMQSLWLAIRRTFGELGLECIRARRRPREIEEGWHS